MKTLYPEGLQKLETELIRMRRVTVGEPPDEKKPRVGLALSGGGIRSATFCLGVCQVLARTGLLHGIDFLSTVSGGGYCGGFLGRLFTRMNGIAAEDIVDPEALITFIRQPDALSQFLWQHFEPPQQEQLQNPKVPLDEKRSILAVGLNESLKSPIPPGTLKDILKNLPPEIAKAWIPDKPLSPEIPLTLSRFLLEQVLTGQLRRSGPWRLKEELSNWSEPISFLRDNGCYLSPNGGGDTWVLVAVFLRNWLAMLSGLMMFAVGAFLFIALVRGFLWSIFDCWPLEAWLLRRTTDHWWWSPLLGLALFVLNALVIPVAWGYWLTQTTWSKSPFIRHVAWVSTLFVLILGVGGFIYGIVFGGPKLMWSAALLTAVQASLAFGMYGFALWRSSHTCEGGTPREKIYSTRNDLSKWLGAVFLVSLVLLALAFVDSIGQSYYALLCEGQGTREALIALGGIMGWSTLVLGASRLQPLLDLLPKSRAVQIPLEVIAAVAAALLALTVTSIASVGAHAVAWRGMAPEVIIGETVIRPGANLMAQTQPPSTNAVVREVEGDRNTTGLRPFAFSLRNVTDLKLLADTLSKLGRPVDAWLSQRLWWSTRNDLETYVKTGSNEESLRTNLLWDINGLIHSPRFAVTNFSGVTFRKGTTKRLSQVAEGSGGNEAFHLNRLLLEDAYPKGLPRHACRPDAPLLFVVFLLAAILSWLLGHTLAFINLSALHALYTARLTRTFLGASNEKRWAGRGRSVSDPIRGDDMEWTEYRPWLAGGPLHLVNITVNETVSGKNQIEYRDRKGLSFAVGPGGLSVGRTDHALWRHAEPENTGEAQVSDNGKATWLKGVKVKWNSSGRPEIDIEPLETEPGQFHALGVARQHAGRKAAATGEVHWSESASLGRWIGISGAAFTTGLGYRTSLAKSLVLGLLNVRLGYWWSSGIGPRDRDEPFLAELSNEDFIDFPSLVGKLKEPAREADRCIAGKLSPETTNALKAYGGPESNQELLRTNLLKDFNGLICKGPICTMGPWRKMVLRFKIGRLRLRTLQGKDLVKFNHLLLEALYSKELSRTHERVGGRTPPNLWSRIEEWLSWAFPVQMHLLQEITARFYGPAMKRWYLSDGGHFENTAAYELLRRKVPYIVVCDSGCDPDYGFEDLGNLVRKARIDFGAEIKFLDTARLKDLGVPQDVRELIGMPTDFQSEAKADKVNDTPRRPKHYALVAKVDFPDSPDGPPLYMLFLKPGLKGDEPLDLLQYQTTHPAFPNESTIDQYFDEAQWESYRKLGEHIGEKVLACESGGASWFLKLGLGTDCDRA